MDRKAKTVAASGKARHLGFLKTSFLVTETAPLIDAQDEGLTIGQMIDKHLRDHEAMMIDAHDRALAYNQPYSGPSAIHSLTIELPREE